jgi:hypothetical protein
MKELLLNLRQRFLDDFPDLANDPESVQYEYIRIIDQVLLELSNT